MGGLGKHSTSHIQRRMPNAEVTAEMPEENAGMTGGPGGGKDGRGRIAVRTVLPVGQAILPAKCGGNWLAGGLNF